jgi:hypothetical protein
VYYLVHMKEKQVEAFVDLPSIIKNATPFIIGFFCHLLIYAIAARIVPFSNFLKHDNVLFELPRQMVFSRSIRSGDIALWDPYTYGGAPFHGVYTSSLLGIFGLTFALLGLVSVQWLGIEALCAGMLGFAGSYLFFLQVDRWARVVCSVSFSASSFMMFQTTLNMEGAFSTASIPWICLGVRMILDDRRFSQFPFALGIAVATTSGYLGLNVLLVYPLSVYILLSLCEKKSQVTLRVLRRLVTGAIFGLIPSSFGLIESWTNGQVKGYFQRGLESYASISYASLRTIVLPVGANGFDLAPDGTQVVSLFIPAVVLCGFSIRALNRREAGLIPSFGALVCAFFISVKLPDSLDTFRNSLPFVADVRYRTWIGGCIIFFLIASSSTGLRATQSLTHHRRLAVSGLIVLQGISTILSGASQLLSGFLIASALTFAYSKARPRQLLVMLAVAQLMLSHLSLDRSNPSLQEIETTRSVSELYNSSSERPFSHTPQKRVIDGKQNGIQNAHYFTQSPAIFGYFPQVMHPISELIESGESDQLSHFVIASNGLEIAGQVTAFHPDRFQFKVGDTWEGDRLIVTFPFSPNFHARVNGHRIKMVQSSSGLIQLEGVKANDLITLTYQPKYAAFYLFAIPLCWLIIAGGTLTSLRRLRCSHSNELAVLQLKP